MNRDTTISVLCIANYNYSVMLKNEEIRQTYPFVRKGLNNFEAECITCGCIYNICKRE